MLNVMFLSTGPDVTVITEIPSVLVKSLIDPSIIGTIS